MRPCLAGRAGRHRERSSDKQQLFVCVCSEAGLVVQNASSYFYFIAAFIHDDWGCEGGSGESVVCTRVFCCFFFTSVSTAYLWLYVYM